MQTESFNPYTAPATPPDEQQLAADTEFLFNDKCVAGVGTIRLPAICVVSGSRDNLMPRVTRLAWCSRWITWPRNASIFGVMSYAPNLLFSGRTGPDATWHRLIGAAILGVAVFATVASLLLRRSVTIHWSLDRGIHNRFRFEMLLITTAGIVICIAVILWCGFQHGMWALIPIVITMFPAIALSHGKRVVSLIGRHDGLFLIGGLSDKFLKETRRVADEHAARIGG